ncbi:hypothetical protein ACG92U_05810 [Leuconostoc citreum]
MSDQTYEKVTTYRRNAFTVLFVVLGILTIISNSLVKHYFIGIDLTFLDTLSNFFAIALGFKLSILYDLSHPERLHKHKVIESDERTQFIRQRADALSLNFYFYSQLLRLCTAIVIATKVGFSHHTAYSTTCTKSKLTLAAQSVTIRSTL